MLYVTRQTYTRMVKGHFDGVPVWDQGTGVSPIGGRLSRPGVLAVRRNGRLEGVDTLIDLNLFMGFRRSFEALLSSS